jgi:hypothetical protein
VYVTLTNRIFVLSATLATSVGGIACSNSSSPASPAPTQDAAPQDATVIDTGVPGPGDSMAPGDGAVACAPGATLFERLGGYTGIHSALEAIVGKELANPEIASYFFNQMETPVPAGHPTAGEIEDCFSVLLAAAAGGPYSYPPDGGVATGDGGTFACRDMATIHQPLLISGGTFDEFVSIAATTLAPTVCASDLAMIGAALEGTKGAIVYAPLADAGLESFPGTVDGGTEQ